MIGFIISIIIGIIALLLIWQLFKRIINSLLSLLTHSLSGLITLLLMHYFFSIEINLLTISIAIIFGPIGIIAFSLILYLLNL